MSQLDDRLLPPGLFGSDGYGSDEDTQAVGSPGAMTAPKAEYMAAMQKYKAVTGTSADAYAQRMTLLKAAITAVMGDPDGLGKWYMPDAQKTLLSMYDDDRMLFTAASGKPAKELTAEEADALKASTERDRALTDKTKVDADKTKAEMGNLESPADKHSRSVDEIAATYRAKTQSDIALLQEQVRTGVKMPEAAAKELDALIARNLAEMKADQDRALESQKQTNALGLAREQSGLRERESASEFGREDAATRRAGQVETLKGQAAQGEKLVGMMVDAGVAPSTGTVRMMSSPLARALRILKGGMESGDLAEDMTVQQPMQAPEPAGAPEMAAPEPVGR